MSLRAIDSVEGPVVERLRLDAHEVLHVAESTPSVVDEDEEVLQQANARGSVLVTADKDFGELVFRQGLVHSGVVLLPPHGKRARKGVFITTGTFSGDATAYVEHIDPKVVLLDGRRLAQLMIDFEVGVTTTRTYSVKRVDSDYFEDA